MNKAILIGRLTRDPEVRYSSGERSMAVARYTLAVDRRGRKSQGEGQTADFIQCVAFDRNGEFAEKYLYKGIKIAVTGRIQTGSYVNKDGQKVYTTEVIVDEHEFVESKAASEEAQRDGAVSSSRNSNKSTSEGEFMNVSDGIDDEALPFF